MGCYFSAIPYSICPAIVPWSILSLTKIIIIMEATEINGFMVNFGWPKYKIKK